MPPRQLLGRLRDELRQQVKRPWSRVYPSLLRDAAIVGSSGAGSLDELWERQAAEPFFLSPADRDRHVTAFRARYPDAPAVVIERADAAIRHEFDLLGSGLKTLGATLPWLDDFKTGRHYPLQYCRDIQYMELDLPTDVKVPWELSRCQHFSTLGQAYWLTGDERYAREYRAEVEDWIAVNPYAYSVNWACAMDVALRAISWIWGFYFMAGADACADRAFRRALLRSLFMHGEFVFTHLETSDVNGNHYLSDGAGLVFLGLFFRHTDRGRHWLARGQRIVFDEMDQQVSEDGVDFEQSTAYHRLVLELFFTSYLLLERYGEPVPASHWARLIRMLEFTAAYTKPNGLAPLIGDADDGRVQKLGTQTINDHRYLLSAGAVRFSRSDLKAASHRFWDESFWLLGPQGAAAFDRIPVEAANVESVAFPAGGFYVLRSSSAHVVVDCGEVGMRGRGGHGHNDILGFELFLNGVNVVSDCGAYLYTASREWRNRFRATASHNVAQIDGEELNRFIGADALWQFHDDARPVGVRWQVGEDGDYFRGGHNGYARLSPPLMPAREILVMRDEPRVVIRDRIEGAGTHTIVWRWHLDPAVTAELAGHDCRLATESGEVWFLPIDEADGIPRIERGWVSPSYGVRQEASLLTRVAGTGAGFARLDLCRVAAVDRRSAASARSAPPRGLPLTLGADQRITRIHSLMRQILMNSAGAVVARVPRPAIEPGSVLVRVQYSLISVGTELAPLKAPLTAASESATTVEKGAAYASLATRYLKASWRDPQKAARRLASIARRQVAQLKPAPKASLAPVAGIGDLQWTKALALAFELSDGRLEISTDDSPGGYQAMTRAIDVPDGQVPLVRVVGTVHGGAIAIGLLNDARDKWIGSRSFDAGRFEDYLIFNPAGSRQVTLVITTAGAGQSRASIETIEVSMAPAQPGGLPYSEMDQQGWSVGYSVAGEIVAVGDGVTDLAAGDLVACAGAGQANHADFVSVKRNLVCRVPAGCPASAAASATIGSIAMQGVRRAAPQLGERVAVIGLGLIGQITVQLLRSAGCYVIGLDLDPARVARARNLGMDDGASDPDRFKTLVRDRTGGMGADRTLMTAATRSDSVVNLAMDVTRAKGTVVIVGDVGLNVQRAIFYRKEIDLLMSTSYGPGRYDQNYEADGRDYPFAYVRWTLNRNMQAYLELIAAGRLNVDALIDRVITVDEAQAAYSALAGAAGAPPLGVLIRYPDDTRDLPEPADAARITVRGHRPPRPELINYALVGAGAFGMSMLVPQMKKRKDRFFLRGVVSRNSTQGGNFARENGVEVLATDLKTVLDDPAFHLMVIATRHHEHAAQVVACLEAGKHVFVEKPLAITWSSLDAVVEAYNALAEKPMLMVGFNRRFSPAVTQIRGLVAGRRAPLMIEYRLNGGYIAMDSWVQGTQGGGRNLGEACHMYDVFRSLTGSSVKSITATSIDPGSLPYLRNDNFTATIGYEDGSVASLVYTALGPKTGMGKERIEVFCDGDAFVVDDFKKLSRASDGAVLWQAGEADKGHAEEFNLLGDAIATGGPAPISFDEIVETTALSLHVEDLLHHREGRSE